MIKFEAFYLSARTPRVSVIGLQIGNIVTKKMKKKFYLNLEKWDKKQATLALESGVDAILVKPEKIEELKSLALTKVISQSKKADLEIGKDIKIVKINSKKDEDIVVAEKGKIPVIIENKDWTIIPLENLISKTSNLIQEVLNASQAKTALQTMERGADGIILKTDDLQDIKEVANIINKMSEEKFKLSEAVIESIEPLGIGDRVCVDTSSMLSPGQGMLVGDSSSAMFLVYNENVKSPYCDPRPFRINAGGVHAYCQLPSDKTGYLSEIKAGSKILVVDPKGNSEEVIVGRAKIEKRPMLLVKASCKGKEISLVIQNAETIRLTSVSGKPVSITKLKKGDKVLVYLQEAGRHFGVKVKESIKEK